MSLSRRSVLGGLTGLGALVLSGTMAGAISVAQSAETKNVIAKPTPDQSTRFAQQGGDFSWKPQKLDLDEVASVAHAGFHYKGYG